MDDFKKMQYKEIYIGGYKCKCCCPIQCINKSKEKQRLHKRARSRLKCKDVKNIKDVNY